MEEVSKSPQNLLAFDLDRLFDDDGPQAAVSNFSARSVAGPRSVERSRTDGSAEQAPELSSVHSDEGSAADEGINRRVLAKLDEERLSGPTGIRLLRYQTKTWRPKRSQKPKLGSRAEASDAFLLRDLDTLLSRYRLWAHQCLPKVAFRDFERSATKLCRSRRMQHHLEELKSAEHRTSAVEFADMPQAAFDRRMDQAYIFGSPGDPSPASNASSYNEKQTKGSNISIGTKECHIDASRAIEESVASSNRSHEGSVGYEEMPDNADLGEEDEDEIEALRMSMI